MKVEGGEERSWGGVELRRVEAAVEKARERKRRGEKKGRRRLGVVRRRLVGSWRKERERAVAAGDWK